jgi:hypothetical protein
MADVAHGLEHLDVEGRVTGDCERLACGVRGHLAIEGDSAGAGLDVSSLWTRCHLATRGQQSVSGRLRQEFNATMDRTIRYFDDQLG